MKSARLVACTIAFVACVSAYAGNAGPYAVCDTLLPKIETDSAAVKAGDNVAAGQQAAGTDSLVAGSDSLAADSSKIAQAVDSVMRDAKKAQAATPKIRARPAARIMACAYTSRSRADIQQEILETSHILWRLPGMYLCTDVEPADVQGLFAGL